jgi:hypothetical protein
MMMPPEEKVSQSAFSVKEITFSNCTFTMRRTLHGGTIMSFATTERFPEHV